MLYIKNGIIRDGRRIVIRKDGFQIISPTEEMILADGWVPYEPKPVEHKPTLNEQMRDLILDNYNARVDISNAEALKRPLLVYGFSTYIGKSLKAGQIVSHNDVLYRARQDIPVVLADQSPGLATAALYEAIEVEATGTEDDPIPYVPPMELFAGKYYTQGDVKYLCTRDTGTAISHDLAEVVNVYVDVVN